MSDVAWVGVLLAFSVVVGLVAARIDFEIAYWRACRKRSRENNRRWAADHGAQVRS